MSGIAFNSPDFVRYIFANDEPPITSIAASSTSWAGFSKIAVLFGSTFNFPATTQHKQAYIEVRRFPAKADLPLTIQRNRETTTIRALALQTTERIVVQLSADKPTHVSFSAERTDRLSREDQRQRSFRIINIDFD